jgi:hypothetical protein
MVALAFAIWENGLMARQIVGLIGEGEFPWCCTVHHRPTFLLVANSDRSQQLDDDQVEAVQRSGLQS